MHASAKMIVAACAPFLRSLARRESQVRELDYCAVLNRVLPRDVRVLGWCPVSDGFSSRFSCSGRTYRYFFARRRRSLQAMRAAADAFVGDHDFRNLCKARLATFVRHLCCSRAVLLTPPDTHRRWTRPT